MGMMRNCWDKCLSFRVILMLPLLRRVQLVCYARFISIIERRCSMRREAPSKNMVINPASSRCENGLDEVDV